MSVRFQPRRWWPVAAGACLAAAALVVRRRAVSNQVRAYTSSVRAGRPPGTPNSYEPQDVAHLPAPVQRYFETVLEPGQRHVAGVRLTQDGEIQLGGASADSGWYPFTATQVYGISPPGYVWDATVDLAPLVSARVFDAYARGEGVLRANLAGAIPVASAGPSPRMNEAELQRYLSETPWFPTALLPAAGVTWEGLDDRTARATIEDGDVTASVTFHFDDRGYVDRVTADRYRQDADAVAPWVGRFRNYQERDGMLIPTDAEVGWETADGDAPYWRGTVTDVTYRTGT